MLKFKFFFLLTCSYSVLPLDLSKEGPTLLWPSSVMSLPIRQDQGTKVVHSPGAKPPHSIPHSSYSKSFAHIAASLFLGSSWASPQVHAHSFVNSVLTVTSAGSIGWLFGGREYINVWAGISALVQGGPLTTAWSLRTGEKWGRMRATCLSSLLCCIQAVSGVSRMPNEGFQVVTKVYFSR